MTAVRPGSARYAPQVVLGTAINEPNGRRATGVRVATVTDNQDPSGYGRVKVRLPWLGPDEVNGYEVWARLATMMGGNNRGTWFIPEVNDEVLVAFDGGNPDHPYVIGSLWNGKDAAPVTIDPDNDVKAIVSRTGIRITLDDSSGAVKLTLETPGGQKVTLADAGSSLKLEDSNGNSVELAPAGITIQAQSKLSISAMSIDVTASTMSVSCPMSTFSGVVQSDTNITNTTVSASYTPGAGNVW